MVSTTLTMVEINDYGNQVIVGVQDLEEFTAAAEFANVGYQHLVILEHPLDPPPERATGCGVSAEELAAARALWASHDLEGYSYTATKSGQILTNPWEVRVWQGEVTEVPLPEDDYLYPLPTRFGIRFGTIERLFDMIEWPPSLWVSAEYDPAFGYPPASGSTSHTPSTRNGPSTSRTSRCSTRPQTRRPRSPTE